MKKSILSMLLLLALLGVTACQGNEIVSDENSSVEEVTTLVESNDADVVITEKPELEGAYRAVEYGIVPTELQNDWDKAIQYAEFNEMIVNMLEIVDNTKLTDWDDFSTIAQTSNTEMIIGDAIAPLYYAISLLGDGAYTGNQWLDYCDGGNSTTWDWQESITSWDMFPDAIEISPFHDHLEDVEPVGWDYYSGGYFWLRAKVSNVDAKPVLSETDDVLISSMSREKAAEVVARLYETTFEQVKTENCEAAKSILVEADTWKEQFYAYQSEEDYTGTVYYISNAGDDKNNGLSEETPWATIDKIRSTSFQPGDAILLEKGSEWYIETLEGASSWWDMAIYLGEGVTLGSYGEGERPIIRGDEPGVHNADNWVLAFEDDDRKIWKYSKALQDANVIVFNQGESMAYKVWPYRTESGYSNKDGTLFDVTEALNQDLTFCSLLDITGVPVNADIGSMLLTGDLYLRCDKGNPATVYEEISIPQIPVGIYQQSDSTVDGINISFFTCLGTCMDSYDGNTGMTISNCELGWCGALISNYQEIDATAETGSYAPYCAGGAIQMSGSDLNIIGNYIHDSGPMALIMSIHGDQPKVYEFKNQLIENNLLSYCGAPFHWADLTNMDNPEAEGFISNMVYQDNMVMYSGYGWVGDTVGKTVGSRLSFYCSVEDEMGAANNDGIYFLNNTFYLSERVLIYYRDTLWDYETLVNAEPVFSGNTYAQAKNGILAIWGGERYPISDDVVKEIFNDSTGKVYVIE